MTSAIESDQSASLFVNRRVKITLNDHKKTVQCGYLACVDPESDAMLVFDQSDNRLCLLFKHSVKSIEELPTNESHDVAPVDLKHLCDEFFGPEEARGAELGEEDCEARRKRVMQVLASHNVPVEEVDHTLIAAYCVSITPPYTINQCKSFNPIVLGRIQQFMQQDMQ